MIDPYYPPGQCTDYCFQTLAWVRKLGQLGDAWFWSTSAKGKGMLVSDTPSVNAVMCLQQGVQGAGSYGHVGVVIAVNGNHVTVNEQDAPTPGVTDTRVYNTGPGVSFISPPPPPPIVHDDEDSEMSVKAQRPDGSFDYFSLMPDGKIQHVHRDTQTYDDTLPAAVCGALIEAHWDVQGKLHVTYHGWTGGPLNSTREGQDGNVCESVWQNGKWGNPQLLANPA